MGVSKKRVEEISKYLSKENLEKYLKEYSANYIAKKLFYPEFETTAGVVIERAKKLNIQTHDFSSSRKLKNTQDVCKKTCLEKYGVKNVSQAQIIKEKKIESSLREYGTINVFQSEEIKEKSRQTCLEKYGTENVGRLGLKSTGKLSKFHRQIEMILSDNNIDFKSEVHSKFISYNEILGRVYSPVVDILLLKYKLVIECYGDFWHANPKFYNENDIFNTWEGPKKAREIREKDDSRIKQIESFGYKVLIIWESDLKHDKQNVEKMILDAISNN